MSLHVPNTWPHVPLEATRVRYPVGAGPLGDLVAQGAFLLGRNKAIVGNVSGLPRANGTVSFWWLKEPGDKALLVRVLMHRGAAAGARATVASSIRTTAGVDTGAGTLSGTTTRHGIEPIECSRTDLRVPSPHERVFDVSSLTVGTRYEIRVTTASSSGTAQGIHSLDVYAIPRDAMNPQSSPSTEPGVSPPFVMARNPIFAGSASTAGDAGQGTERLVHVMDQVRSQTRRYPLQIATIQSTTHAWSRTNVAFGDLDWKFAGGAGVPRFTTRAKKLYAAGTDNALQASVLYSTSSGAATGTLRLTRESDGATYDVTLPGSTSFTNATGSVFLETGGAEGEDSWTLTGKATAGTLYIAGIALYDNEP